ncbi:MAG: hypothetical protein FRX48_02578 [Lasallia pustulata]|uniref:Uncharacterized protein n=1 Tax=Lasallia pustulata TaxID=136370 RepID=A0A5M8PX27_9LECA|nr:MAG: hypothetical protein FRX48_02578 [Lasallia pustulata]
MRSIKKSASSEIGVAYLYYDYYESRKVQTPGNMVSSLTRQLVQQSSQLDASIKELYEDVKRSKVARTSEQDIDMFKAAVSRFSSTYIIVDALDECSEVDTPEHDTDTKRFLSALKEEISPCTTVLVTCRTNDYLNDKFKEMSLLEIRARNEDLVSYIKGRTNKKTCLGRHVHYKAFPGFEGEISQKIVSSCDGIFLLAKLQLDHLTDQISPQDTFEALESIPKTLQERYEKAINRMKTQVSPNRANQAMRILAWISHAKRPLRVEELRHALSVRTGDTTLQRSRFPTRDDLTHHCLGLVSIDQASRTLRLVHYTLQQYLQETGKDLFPDAEVQITRSCLDYLLLQSDVSSVLQRLLSRFESLLSRGLSPLRRPHPIQIIPDRHYRQYKFLDYATRYWGIHARHNAEETLRESILHYLKLEQEERTLQFSNEKSVLLPRFVASSPYCVCGCTWSGNFCLCKRQKGPDIHYHGSIGLLHRVAAWGFTYLAEELLNKGCHITSHDDHGWTALFWAARHGHEDILNLLIKKNANADAKCTTSIGDTPLFWAALYGHETVVDILLKHGADANHVSETYEGTAMGAAIGRDHIAVVRLLLNVGVKADDDLHGLGTSSALIAAASSGNEDITELLIEYGADINIASDVGKFRHPLTAAASNRHINVIETLASEGANINITQKRGWESQLTNPLLAAVTSYEFMAGCETLATVRRLIDLGADPNMRDSRGRTALYEAVKLPSYSLVEMLLKHGAATNVYGRGHTPLQWALQLQDQNTVLLLLQHHADPNMAKYGLAPLSVAISWGYTPIIDQLQAYGACRICASASRADLKGKLKFCPHLHSSDNFGITGLSTDDSMSRNGSLNEGDDCSALASSSKEDDGIPGDEMSGMDCSIEGDDQCTDEEMSGMDAAAV